MNFCQIRVSCLQFFVDIHNPSVTLSLVYSKAIKESTQRTAKWGDVTTAHLMEGIYEEGEYGKDT